jgi:lipopolysaccharide export system protein LptA
MTQPGFVPRRLLASFTCLAALALPPSAGAEQADRNKPIHFSAEQPAEVDFDKRVGTLRGNVVITQGTLTIHADKIDFKQNPDNSLSATAYGNPIDFREKKEGSDEYYEGYAQKAVYNGETHTLELFDNALLKEGNNEFRGNYISYNSDTNFMKAEGRPNAPGGQGPGPRVQGVFEPRSDSPLGKASSDKGGNAKGAGKSDAKSAPKPDGKGGDAAKSGTGRSGPPLALTPDSTLSAK